MRTFLALLACSSSIKLGPADSGVGTDVGPLETDSAATADGGADTAVDTGADDTTVDTGPDVPDDCRPAGLLADASLLLEGGTAVHGYGGGPFDAATPMAARLGVNSTAPCAANVSGAIDGDLSLVGDPDTVLCLGYGGTVSGAATQVDAPMEVAGASPPVMPPSSGALVLAYAGAQTITQDATYDSVSLGGASTLTIDGDVDLLVTGDVSSAGTITLTEGSRLHLWVGGAARFEWATQVNPSGAAEQVLLDVLGTHDVTLAWESRAVMRVAHPSGRVNLEGGTLIGTVVAQELRATWGSTVHVDMSDACAR